MKEVHGVQTPVPFEGLLESVFWVFILRNRYRLAAILAESAREREMLMV
jgi:hypothetical protein